MALAISFCLAVVANACSLIVVGKDATADGCVIVAHTDDAGGGTSDVRLVKVPAMDHPQGALRPVFNAASGYPRFVTDTRGPGYRAVDGQTNSKPLGYISQVRHTYAYWDQDYGLMNEHQLVFGESTVGAKTAGWPKDVGGHNLFMIEELSKIALERCESARCAIKTMGELAEEHGFFGDADSMDDPDYWGSAEALGIGDKYGEAWIFHIMTGPKNRSAIWAAQRVKDDQLAIVPNGLIIREMDLNDTDNFMASKNIVNQAVELGFYNPARDGAFDFTRAFGVIPTNSHHPFYIGRRHWRVFDLVAPSLHLDSNIGWSPQRTYPFSVKPDTKISVETVMKIYRDHFEGTQFDMTKGIAAGPFGNPARYDGDNKGVQGDWERQLSMFRTTFSFVANTRPWLPDTVGGIFWFGFGSPHSTVYVPVYSNQAGLPDSYSIGKQSEFSTESAWWAFGFVHNWIQLRWDAMMVDVRQLQGKLEKQGFELQARHEKSALLSQDGKPLRTQSGKVLANPEATQVLYTATWQHAHNVVTTWWAFAWKLVAKYADGYVTVGEESGQRTQPGYPAWWLSLTNFHRSTEWPPASIEAVVTLSPAATDSNLRLLVGVVSMTIVGLLVFSCQRRDKFIYERLP